jgi:ribonuclease P protein component
VVLPVTLKKRAKFVEISRYGLRAKTEVLISICQRDPGPYARVGYTASKKVGNAVKRNKAKRRLRHLVREMSGHFVPGYAFVLIATPLTASCKFETLRSGFVYCIERSMERSDRGRQPVDRRDKGVSADLFDEKRML